MKLHVTLVKSPISSKPNHVKVVEALGLHKMHQTKVHQDTPSIRGMIFRVKHLVRVEEIAD
ncbi:MAG: 50S ribosomal protein L30 [Oscillospiraceae bacterium]|jgi:large subunit ribosomal protein L30|nr:50S ribosomal protein L30 [Oscillospiraceae bacterium]